MHRSCRVLDHSCHHCISPPQVSAVPADARAFAKLTVLLYRESTAWSLARAPVKHLRCSRAKSIRMVSFRHPGLPGPVAQEVAFEATWTTVQETVRERTCISSTAYERAGP